jgi:hypothetical protein
LEPSPYPLTYSLRYEIPCDVHFRNHLLELPLRRPMGCCSSKHVDSPSATVTTEREVTQRQSSPVTQPVARASERSPQHSHAGHESPPVEEASIHERPQFIPQKPPPMGVVEDLPPQLPSHRTRAKSSSSRNLSTLVSAGEHYGRWSTHLSHRQS